MVGVGDRVPALGHRPQACDAIEISLDIDDLAVFDRYHAPQPPWQLRQIVRMTLMDGRFELGPRASRLWRPSSSPPVDIAHNSRGEGDFKRACLFINTDDSGDESAVNGQGERAAVAARLRACAGILI
jgi:hypothetical protein